MRLGLALIGLLLGASCVEVRHRAVQEEGSPCQSSAQCPPAAPVCDVEGSATCVQCTAAEAFTCGGTTPVCGEEQACRGCAAHEECASNACSPDGSCLAEADVLYVKGGLPAPPQNGGALCSKSEPCGTMAAAVAAVTASRRFIRVSGTTSEGALSAQQKTFTVLGEPGATWRSGAAVLLDAKGSTIELYDLTLDPTDTGVRMEGGRLSLTRCKISGGRAEALLITDGVAELSQTEVTETGGSVAFGGRRALQLNRGELVVDRSLIARNPGGGIFAANGQRVSVTNSFIVGNSGSGGVRVGRLGAGSKLEHNTIVDNRITLASLEDGGGGVFCDEATFVGAGNLIFRNQRLSGVLSQTDGSCRYGNSFVASGTGAADASLGFRSNVAPFDYHLTGTSPASVVNAAGTCSGVDFDGDVRGADGSCDLGADELAP